KSSGSSRADRVTTRPPWPSSNALPLGEDGGRDDGDLDVGDVHDHRYVRAARLAEIPARLAQIDARNDRLFSNGLDLVGGAFDLDRHRPGTQLGRHRADDLDLEAGELLAGHLAGDLHRGRHAVLAPRHPLGWLVELEPALVAPLAEAADIEGLGPRVLDGADRRLDTGGGDHAGLGSDLAG